MEMDLARLKWNNHKGCATARGLKPLDFESYVQKIREAGISVKQIGKGRDKYMLGRYTDKGDYTATSCRFITMLENIEDRKRNGGNDLISQSVRAYKQNHPMTEEHKRYLGKLMGERMEAANSKYFSYINEDGQRMRGKNFNKYCRENFVQGRKGIEEVGRGWRQVYRGWRVDLGDLQRLKEESE